MPDPANRKVAGRPAAAIDLDADDARGDGELAPLPKGRVLVVDDGLDQQVVGRILLERLG